MALATRTVFLDSEVFKRIGLHFGGKAIEEFRGICSKGGLESVTTTVVVREVRRHIEQSVREASDSLRKFQRKARILSESKSFSDSPLFEPFNEDELKEEALKAFDSFLEETGTKVLDLSNVDAEQVFDSYINESPPFGPGKKKDEFPDAFTLAALESEAEARQVRIYVVSHDGDLINFCDDKDALVSIDNLDELLDLYNSHESAISAELKQYFALNTAQFHSEVIASIDMMGIDNAGDWEDSDVIDSLITVTQWHDPRIVSIHDTRANLNVDIDIDIEATVTGPDWTNGIYDSETGLVIPLHTITKPHAESTTVTAEFELKLNFENQILKDVEISDTAVANSFWGVAINAEEQDDWY